MRDTYKREDVGEGEGEEGGVSERRSKRTNLLTRACWKGEQFRRRLGRDEEC